MPNTWFQFKQFTIHQDRCAMKVTTDSCLFGAWVASHLPQAQAPVSVLDIGCGTGLLSLMLAQAHANLQIDAVEIDPDAASQAAENCAASPWNDRIRVFHADIKSNIPGLRSNYDIIITNPPFYENELAGNNDKKNIAHHNKNLILKDLLDIIANKIGSSGEAFILFPAKREATFINQLKNNQLNLLKLVKIQQSPAHPAFRLFGHFQAKQAQILNENIIITDLQGSYSDQFNQLLKQYYLNL